MTETQAPREWTNKWLSSQPNKNPHIHIKLRNMLNILLSKMKIKPRNILNYNQRNKIN